MRAPPRQRRLIEQAADEPLPSERLAPPSPAAQALMATHLRDQDGYDDFDLERDVYLGGGGRTPSQLLTWDPSLARFWCANHPGLVISTGELTPEMVERAQLFDEGLRPHLAGLGTPLEREEMTRRYLRGDLNREKLRGLRAAGARRRTASAKRPEIAERRRRVQEWMLTEYAELGVFERVLDAAEAMQEHEPDRWYALARCQSLSRITLSRYWYDIPQPKRDAVRLAHERRAQRN